MSEMVELQKDDVGVIVRVMLTFDQAADDYLGDCERRGFRPRSIATYRRTYTEFADRLPIATDVSKITTDDIRRYLNTKNNLANGTRAGIEAHLGGLFNWLLREGKIAKDPMLPVARTKRIPSEDLDVTTVSTEEVKRMIAAAQGWTERLCIGVLVYTGVRRHAASTLRLRDYDELHRRLRFHEKGGKTIWKPVPDELDNLIRAAIAAGVYQEDDHLIPNSGARPRTAERERDDRFIWRTVKDVAQRAGVRAHTHALRAAFAVYYLETHQRDTLALQSLLGHRSGNTTQIYLRKLDRQAEMERVRDLSWGVSVGADSEGLAGTVPPLSTPLASGSSGCSTQLSDEGNGATLPVAAAGDAASSGSSQIADVRFDEDRLVGAGGFEPPQSVNPHEQRAHSEHLADALRERLDQAVSEKAEEPV